MGNIYKPMTPEIRATEEYAEAKSLYMEKREAQTWLKEINRRLRALSQTDTEAVERARIEIPFRKAHGRSKKIRIVKIPELYTSERMHGLADTE